MSNSIKFNMNDDDIPVIEEITTDLLETSIFSKQYTKAIKEINDFYFEEASRNINSKFFYKQENHNNIFALIGERGSGKTSCMLSIANLLCSSYFANPDSYQGAVDARNQVFIDAIGENNELEKKEFIPLEIIDPSFFDDKHNILAIIIAKMFALFEKDIKENPFSDDSNKRNVLELFTKVQKDFEVLFLNDQTQTFSDNVENLVSLSCAVNLKEDLESLIQKWLEYISKRKKVGKDDCVLLITIDDIDLNTRCADIMMEEIRKYLIQKNVLVLISFNIEQLSMVKEQSLIKTYEILINQNKSPEMFERIKHMAETYLTKFIPLNNRIYMPDFSTNLKLPLLFDKENDQSTQQSLSADQKILTYIYNKTRFLFYNTAKRTNPIIPNNLRQVRQLIKLLWNCEEYDSQPDPNDIKTKNSNEYNKELFKKYFYGDWCKRNLIAEYEDFINKLNNIKDPTSINYFVIKELRNIYENEFKKENGASNKELENIFNPENQDYNLSIGDVYAVIFLIERTNSIEIQNLLFALKTFYSMKLYEFYDKRIELSLNKSAADGLVIRTVDYLENITEYEKLVGGSFINTRCIPISAINQRTKQSRVLRSINLQPLKNKINEFTVKINKFLEDKSKNNNKLFDDTDNINNLFNNTEKNIFNIIEFFILCTSRVNSRRHHDELDLNSSYRTDNEPYYNVSFGSKGAVIFDIGSFLFNVTRLKACYDRFSIDNKSFYDIAKELDFSLLHKFKESLKIREENFYRNYNGISDSKKLTKLIKKELEKDLENNYEQRWLSFASIRNYEILDDIINQLLLKQEGDAKSNPSDIVRLSKIFETIGSYSKETYSLSEQSNRYYRITFSFAKQISDVLNNIKPTSEEDVYFTSIYSDNLLFPINLFTGQGFNGVDFLVKVEDILKQNNISYDIDKIKSYISYDNIKYTILRKEKIRNLINILNTLYTLPED